MKITLLDLLVKVEENKLSTEQLEDYYDQLCNVTAKMHIECAELEKKESMFMLQNRKTTDIETKREWRASSDGLRLTLLNRYIKAANKITSSVKNRIYSKI